MTTKNRMLNGCPGFGGRNGYNHHLAPTSGMGGVLYFANAPLDLIARLTGERVGHKNPARIETRAGGPGANGGQVFATRGVPCGVACLQGEGWASSTCEKELRRLGLEPLVIQRNGGRAALSLIVPNGKPNTFDLYCQRIVPNIRLAELEGELTRRIENARVVIAGPMATPDEETIEVLRHIADHAQISVCQPHPDLIRHPAFAEVGGRFSLLVMNGAEAKLLNASSEDAFENARHLQEVLGEGPELIITNGAEKGWAWLRGSWWPFEPPPVDVVGDAGAGDVFTAEFLFRYYVKCQSARTALAEAMRTAALWISGQPLVDPNASAGVVTLERVSDNNAPSWAEIAL